MAASRRTTIDARRERIACIVSVAVILPLLLAALELLATRAELKFLLVPPLAAIGYRIFRFPWSRATTWRSIVVAPMLGSLLGFTLSTAGGGLSSWTTAAGTVGGVAIIELLDAEAPPTLAIILLALFVHATWRFPVGVVVATISLSLIFRVWRWTISRSGLVPLTGPSMAPRSE